MYTYKVLRRVQEFTLETVLTVHSDKYELISVVFVGLDKETEANLYTVILRQSKS